MTGINQIRVSWQGTGVVGNAYSTLYATGTTTATNTTLSALVSMFTAIKALIPASITITVPTTGQQYDDVTGQLLGAWSGAGGASIVGTGTGAFGGASGASVKWITGAIVRRHGLVGRTYLVPLIGSAFNAAGVLAPASVSTILSGAANVSVAGTARVWSRPNAKKGYAGASAIIGSVGVSNVDAVLRSRRQ
jgi:hypothetical protein